MTELVGKGVCSGIAEGYIVFYKKKKREFDKRTDDAERELVRLDEALVLAKEEILLLEKEAISSVGKEESEVFAIHAMMLSDDDFLSSVKDYIGKKLFSAEYSVKLTCEAFARRFSESGDDYMISRAEDVLDIGDRVIDILSGKEEKNIFKEGERVILCAENLSPSETLTLDKRSIVAFVTSEGSVNSHTAILAKNLGIPAVVAVGEELLKLSEYENAFVDGSSGKVFVSPNEEITLKFKEMISDEARKKASLSLWKNKKAITSFGKEILVYSNIGSVEDAEHAIDNGAEGIGLFRSEFLFIGRKSPPSEEEQFRAYSEVLKKMGSLPVIIRTLDIGADKEAEYIEKEKGANPAMGLRGIRLCFERLDLFKTQLRALYRASAFGNLSLLLPMINSLDEVKRAKGIMKLTAEELSPSDEGLFERVSVGIMIETPSAALMSDILAKEVDFFSIGTNDLTQYTLAVDRENESVLDFFEPHSEALLRLIDMTVKNAHENGIWVGICGELGADTKLTKRFIDMGIDEFSVSPPYVSEVKRAIIEGLGG